MGVYIKGMKMPTRCEDCLVCHYMERGTITVCGCKATMMIRPIDCNSKPHWCPLVEVPTHGRLGDLDKLEKMFADIDSAPYSCFDGAEPFYSAEDAAHIIKLAPTIIPAEEGE